MPKIRQDFRFSQETIDDLMFIVSKWKSVARWWDKTKVLEQIINEAAKKEGR